MVPIVVCFMLVCFTALISYLGLMLLNDSSSELPQAMVVIGSVCLIFSLLGLGFNLHANLKSEIRVIQIIPIPYPVQVQAEKP